MKRHILIIEDNGDLARLLEVHLRDLSYEVEVAGDGVSGLARAEAGRFDLIILDLMLPGLDGVEVCRRLRARHSYIPILMLTSRSSELDRVLGLEIGADDYVTKPFSIVELIARVKALLRRVELLARVQETSEEPVISVGKLKIDPKRRNVLRRGSPVDLTAKEFDLLLYFARNQGRVFTRVQLLDAIWGYSHDGYEHTVNSHINRLRAKIEDDPGDPRYLETVWGVGYRLGDA